MKKLLLLVLIVAAGWYGWKNYPQILNKQPAHKAIIVNQTGRDMQRVRLVVDGQTLVRETLADNQEAELQFKVANDSEFQLIWQWTDAPGEFRWSGGRVPRGPMVQKHKFIVDGANEVVYQTSLI
jgi:hypothetical protein